MQDKRRAVVRRFRTDKQYPFLSPKTKIGNEHNRRNAERLEAEHRPLGSPRVFARAWRQ
jgi:hypothetical protein